MTDALQNALRVSAAFSREYTEAVDAELRAAGSGVDWAVREALTARRREAHVQLCAAMDFCEHGIGFDDSCEECDKEVPR